MEATEKIWMNGEFVDWADATRPRRRRTASTTAPGVFEGIRGYETPTWPRGLPPRATTWSACTPRRA